MRRDTSSHHVSWNATVQPETLDKFDAVFPVHGARTWTIETAVEKFLAVVENDKVLQARIHEAIQDHLHLEPKPKGARSVNLKLRTGLYDRFNDLFPEFGATSWFIRNILLEFSKVVEARDLILEQVVENAVTAVIPR